MNDETIHRILDLDLDLDADDIKRIEQQETIFMTQQKTAHSNDTSPNDPAHQLSILSAQVEAMTGQLDQIRHEKYAKEGEIAILRTKLTQTEQEKFASSKKHAEKLDDMDRERQTMIAHLQNEINRLHTELKFKENEARSTAKNEAGLKTKADGFGASFSDLQGASLKRPRPSLAPSSRALVVESSCETEEDALSKTLASMHVLDETTFTHPELMVLQTVSFPYSYRTCSMSLSAGLIKFMVGLTGSPLSQPTLVAIEDVAGCDRKKATQISQAIRSRAGACPLLRTGKMSCSDSSISALKTLVGEFSPEQCTNLMGLMCTFISKTPIGKFYSLMRQHLRILKHILHKTTDPIPDCVMALFQSGALLRQVDCFAEKRTIFLFEMTQLILLLRHDRRLSMELLRQDQKLEISIIGFLNEVMSQRISKTPYHIPLRNEVRAVICCLYQLVLDRMFPASVAFEPATLRFMCRRMAMTLWNSDQANIEHCFPDLQAFMILFHQVIVIEQAPIFKLVHREFYNLIFVAKRLVVLDRFSPLIRPMMNTLDKVFLDVREGKYLPIPIPELERRPAPLSEEEEIAYYKHLFERTEPSAL